MTSSKNHAIQAALENRWEDAVKINKKLLKDSPENIDTLNRLAFAYMKFGDYKKSNDTYKKVLKFDGTNPIALKNLQKLTSLPKKGVKPNGILPQAQYMEDQFIEEAGKTKTIDLKNVADKKTLLYIQSGDSVSLVIKRSKIFAQTGDKKYIGMLPDNVGTRLISLMKGGNEYRACIKANDGKIVTVFIKETKKATRFKNQPSFSSTPYSVKTR